MNSISQLGDPTTSMQLLLPSTTHHETSTHLINNASAVGIINFIPNYLNYAANFNRLTVSMSILWSYPHCIYRNPTTNNQRRSSNIAPQYFTNHNLPYLG